MGYLEGWREVILEEPKLDRRLSVLEDAQHHDAKEPLIEMSRSHREDVDGRVSWVCRLVLCRAECATEVI